MEMGCEIPREADECDVRAEVQRECLENEIKGVLGMRSKAASGKEKTLLGTLSVIDREPHVPRT